MSASAGCLRSSALGLPASSWAVRKGFLTPPVKGKNGHCEEERLAGGEVADEAIYRRDFAARCPQSSDLWYSLRGRDPFPDRR
jgi:hypothetical protein